MISNKHPWSERQRLGLALLFTSFYFLQTAFAQQVNNQIFAHRAAAEYHRTQAQFQAATNDSPAAWQFARACYNFADFATNDDARAELANQGIDACRKLIKEDPKSGSAHYYLAMNLGQLARTEYLGALKLVKEMEREFKIAWNFDPKVDHGGPARSLGLLYRDAPGWPASIGSKHKAQDWLERAEHFEPGFPENPMVLAESYLKWDEAASAAETLKSLDKIWPSARTNFTGPDWERDWVEWPARKASAQIQISNQVSTSSPPKNSRPAK